MNLFGWLRRTPDPTEALKCRREIFLEKCRRKINLGYCGHQKKHHTKIKCTVCDSLGYYPAVHKFKEEW